MILGREIHRQVDAQVAVDVHRQVGVEVTEEGRQQHPFGCADAAVDVAVTVEVETTAAMVPLREASPCLMKRPRPPSAALKSMSEADGPDEPKMPVVFYR